MIRRSILVDFRVKDANNSLTIPDNWFPIDDIISPKLDKGTPITTFTSPENELTYTFLDV